MATTQYSCSNFETRLLIRMLRFSVRFALRGGAKRSHFSFSRLRSFPCAVCTHFALRKRLRKTVIGLLTSRKKCRPKPAITRSKNGNRLSAQRYMGCLAVGIGGSRRRLRQLGAELCGLLRLVQCFVFGRQILARRMHETR